MHPLFLTMISLCSLSPLPYALWKLVHRSCLDVVAHRNFIKKVCLKFLVKLTGKTVRRVSFLIRFYCVDLQLPGKNVKGVSFLIRFQDIDLQLYWKREYCAVVFLQIFVNFLRSPVLKNIKTAASACCDISLESLSMLPA